jgi:hypothetical protein
MARDPDDPGHVVTAEPGRLGHTAHVATSNPQETTAGREEMLRGNPRREALPARAGTTELVKQFSEDRLLGLAEG